MRAGAFLDAVLKEIYRTSDLYYAAYLKVAGVVMVGTDWEGARMFFLFEWGPGLKDLKTQYFMDIAKVPALSYAQSLKALKALTHTKG